MRIKHFLNFLYQCSFVALAQEIGKRMIVMNSPRNFLKASASSQCSDSLRDLCLGDDDPEEDAVPEPWSGDPDPPSCEAM